MLLMVTHPNLTIGWKRVQEENKQDIISYSKQNVHNKLRDKKRQYNSNFMVYEATIQNVIERLNLIPILTQLTIALPN